MIIIKDKRLTPAQIDKLLANNPSNKIEIKVETPEVKVSSGRSFVSTHKDFDTLNAEDQIKTFCAFIRDVVSRYEENKRRQDEAELQEMDLEHCIELAEKLTEKEKKTLYTKLTDVLQERRACKSENEILESLYLYFNDRVLLNKLSQLQGTVSNMKDILQNRTYGCRTSILDDFRV